MMEKKKVLVALVVLAAGQAACSAQVEPSGDVAAERAERTGTGSAAQTIWAVNVRSAFSGMCLNVLNMSQSNGARVVQAADCDENSSKWEFVDLGTGYYNIRAIHSGQCLNVLNFGFHNGDPVVQALDCNEYSSQWWIQDRGNGLLNIRARHDGLCLNVLNMSKSNGASVVQALDCDEMTSRWYIPQPGAIIPFPLPTAIGGPVCDACMNPNKM
jgi:hypothetical protein